MAIYEILLKPEPQTFQATLPNGTFQFRVVYADAPEAGWIMDIAEVQTGASLVAGVPLVTGVDLLAPYRYLGFTAPMWVTTDGDPDAVPTYANLGVTSHLWISA
jgi:hypothetical protein